MTCKLLSSGYGNSMSDILDTASQSDPISPVEIVHDVEDIVVDGHLEQHYNFVDYHFEKYGAYCWARTYLDEIDSVSLHGPYRDRGSEQEVSAPELRNEVIAYLKRRFSVIEAPGDRGPETIWERAG
ncbi:MAG: hypothetical protein HKN11_15945 [Rhizobiales bacterium]|nr:hypothetical protein [Hyphomicrobiales bacterium]